MRVDMQQLEVLTREASALAQGETRAIPIHALTADEAEVGRILQICNACRYCEGFARSFPLCLHLGCVMATFATMPYGKFAHGVFRCAALLKWTIERRQSN